jgi:hypothetical protein
MAVSLYQDWINAKEAERALTERRRAIEDEMTKHLETDSEGVVTFTHEGYKIKVTIRMDRKVNGDLAKEIASANGLDSYLSTLFRWKPELNLTAWKGTTSNITGIFADAITTKPGRPSFEITKEV